MTTFFKTALQRPIESTRDLLDYLFSGARPADRWGIGVEMENLIVDADSGEAVDYPRIEQLLRHLERDLGWEGIREGAQLLGLKGPASSITLEPGGQLELSGELCADLHCCSRGYRQYLEAIRAAGEPLNLTFLGLGTQPFTPLDRIDWLPKARYAIMGPYMARTGDMGQRMMKQSAGVQVNLDFSDEADCLDKMRLAMALAPLLYALFANSPILEDRPTGFLSTRGEIWSRTDPDRTGLLPRLFAPTAGLADYVDYALDVPMYFLYRNGAYLDLTGDRFTFRDYLERGHGGAHPILGDWDLHLSTLFPEVRLRPQIEIRCADSVPPRLALAVGALLKGLLYDAPARTALRSLVAPLATETLLQTYRRSWSQGLRTPVAGGTLGELAVQLIALAEQGLARQRRLNPQGEDEGIFLREARALAESGTTLAERLLADWRGSRQEKLERLKNHCELLL